MAGECYAFVSDAHPNRDIQNVSLLKGPGFTASIADSHHHLQMFEA